MQRRVMQAGLGVAVALAVLWLTGAFGAMEALATSAQHLAQDRLAGAVRALRGGDPAAMWGLVALAFGYGIAHAAGPGHGKVLIGSYGVAASVPFARLAGIALAASLAQAAVAVGLVYATVGVLGWTRDRVLGAATALMAPVGHVLIAGLGLWLVWRGFGSLRRQAAVGARPGLPAPAAHAANDHHGHHDHDHDHDHGPACTHAHGPTLEQIRALRGSRDVAALIAGIAIRPCSGALFVLILTWQLGIGLAGVLSAFAMGLGTALVTIAVAGLAVWAREGAVAGLSGHRSARILPLFEVLAGGVIVVLAIRLAGVSG